MSLEHIAEFKPIQEMRINGKLIDKNGPAQAKMQ